jgi:hypothetical protein
MAELVPSALEQIERQLGGGPEAPAFHQNRLLVVDLRRLDHVPARSEHRRICQALLDELEAHQAVVHPRERGPSHLEHVDLDPAPWELLH